MKFLYKIFSGYDGFTPRRLQDRFVADRKLVLGWARYLDAVELGAEVWVYFHGPHRFTNGVYAKGFVEEIRWKKQTILLRLREYSTNEPLTDTATATRVAQVVSPRYRQVFLFPSEWVEVGDCAIGSTAATCAAHMCDSCPTWSQMPIIPSRAARTPRFLRGLVGAHVPAYWVVPSRCYWTSGFNGGVLRASEVFYRFKLGEESLAFPLALGIHRALCNRRLLDFDFVVPIPLSPDKEEARELHRTRLLARELGRLLGVPVKECLRLRSGISKRAYLAAGHTRSEFEEAYLRELEICGDLDGSARILVLDDVATHGTTLRCAARKLLGEMPEATLCCASAGQMIVKAAVADTGSFLA